MKRHFEWGDAFLWKKMDGEKNVMNEGVWCLEIKQTRFINGEKDVRNEKK